MLGTNFPNLSGSRKSSKGGAIPKVLILRDEPPPLGGVRVLASQTSRLLRELDGIEFEDVEFDSFPGSIMGALVRYWKRLRAADAVLFQIGDFLSISRKRALAFIIVARILRKPIIFRGFAGGIKEIFRSLGSVERFVLIRAALAVSVMTFETRADMEYFSPILRRGGVRVHWLPNTRAPGGIRVSAPRRVRRFCFFGRVCRDKGVQTILDAQKGLPEGVLIDIYGELAGGEEGRELSSMLSGGLARYCGAISPEDIPVRLAEYDCLILPTTWQTEGYPGVVLEAFAAGIPVICTRWNAIPELVDDSCGILVEPNSPSKLREAMVNMHADEELWKRMAKGACARIKEFDPKDWAIELHNWVSEVVCASAGVSWIRTERVGKEN